MDSSLPAGLSLPLHYELLPRAGIALNTLASPGMSSEMLLILPGKRWWWMSLFVCLEIPPFLAITLGEFQDGHLH